MTIRTDDEYLGADYFAVGEDIRNYAKKIVTTRKPHTCASLDGQHEIPIGSRAICESGIDPDSGRVSCHICLDCVGKFIDEMEGD